MQHTVDRVIAKHTWIAEWKRAESGRSVIFSARGVTPWDDEAEEYQTIDARAWHQAGLRGNPNYQLSFARYNDPDSTLTTVFVGDDDPHALVVYAVPSPNKANQRHWFDTLHVENRPWPKKPLDYVVISPDGKWQSHTTATAENAQ